MTERTLEYTLNEQDVSSRPVREFRVPSWYREGMSDSEYERHTIATFVGRRDMYLDIPEDDLARVLACLPEGF